MERTLELLKLDNSVNAGAAGPVKGVGTEYYRCPVAVVEGTAGRRCNSSVPVVLDAEAEVEAGVGSSSGSLLAVTAPRNSAALSAVASLCAQPCFRSPRDVEVACLRHSCQRHCSARHAALRMCYSSHPECIQERYSNCCGQFVSR